MNEVESSCRVSGTGGQLATDTEEEDFGKDFRGDAEDGQFGVGLSAESDNHVLERLDLG